MGQLTAVQQLRLYEDMDVVCAALPAPLRRGLPAVWRQVAWAIPDTDDHQILRGNMYRALPELARDSWTWILAVLRDDHLLTQRRKQQRKWRRKQEELHSTFGLWLIDHGFASATST